MNVSQTSLPDVAGHLLAERRAQEEELAALTAPRSRARPVVFDGHALPIASDAPSTISDVEVELDGAAHDHIELRPGAMRAVEDAIEEA